MANQTKSKDEWQKHIKDYKKSSLTKTNFCEKHGINVHTLNYWMKKLSVIQDEVIFAKVLPSKPDPQIKMQITSRTGVKLDFFEIPEREALEQILKVA